MNYFQVVQEFRRTPKWSTFGRRQQDRQARPACVADFAAADADHSAKQVWRFFDVLEGPRFVSKLRRQSRFDLLPGQALGQHRQRMTRVDHLIEAAAKEVVGHRLEPFKTPAKTLSFSSYIFRFLRVWCYRNYPENLAFMRVASILQGRLNTSTDPANLGGLGRNLTTDTRIFNLLLLGPVGQKKGCISDLRGRAGIKQWMPEMLDRTLSLGRAYGNSHRAGSGSDAMKRFAARFSRRKPGIDSQWQQDESSASR